MRLFTPGQPNDIRYHSDSDLLAQVADELQNRPESCFANNLNAWYDSAYAQQEENATCDYQVAINEELCPDGETEPPSTVEDIIDLIGAFAQGKTRRVVRVAIRIACREALKNNAIRTSQDV